MIENRKSTETVKQWQWWTAVQRSGCRQSWPSSLSDEVPSAYRACQRSQRWKGVHSQRSVRSRTGFENIGENSPCLQMSSASHALHLPSRWWSTCYQRYPEISRWNFPWTSPHELGHCGFFGAKVTRLGTSCRARQGWVAIEWASCLGAKTNWKILEIRFPHFWSNGKMSKTSKNPRCPRNRHPGGDGGDDEDDHRWARASHWPSWKTARNAVRAGRCWRRLVAPAGNPVWLPPGVLLQDPLRSASFLRRRTRSTACLPPGRMPDL